MIIDFTNTKGTPFTLSGKMNGDFFYRYTNFMDAKAANIIAPFEQDNLGHDPFDFKQRFTTSIRVIAFNAAPYADKFKPNIPTTLDIQINFEQGAWALAASLVALIWLI